MALFRYRITPRSAFATPLRSDTLYGHLLWVAAEWEGAAAVQELIAGFAGNKPSFRLSSASPTGCLPMPVLPGIPRDRFTALFGKNGDLITVLGQYKQYRKKRWLPLDTFIAYQHRLSHENLFAEWCQRGSDQNRSAFSVQDHQPHNSIDRRTGKVMEEDGLHFAPTTCYADGARLDLYVETDHLEQFENLFERLSREGYGADRTIGKGQFDFERDEAFDPGSLTETGSHQLCLSLCSAANQEAFEGFWVPVVKHGRTWSGHGERNPFKKPFLAYGEGSVFEGLPEGGYLLRDIHSNPEIVQVTWPVTIPVTLESHHADQLSET